MNRVFTLSLFVLAGVVGVGGSLVSAGFLETYGNTTTSSDLLQAVRSGWLAPALGTAIAFFAATTAGRLGWAWLTALLVSGSSVIALAVAGRAAIEHKRGGYFSSPPCTAAFERSGAPAPGRLSQIQAALDALRHPAGFPGGGDSGPAECSYALDLHNLDHARAFYRPALVGAGWQITRDDARSLVAKRHHLTFRLERHPLDPSVWVTGSWSAFHHGHLVPVSRHRMGGVGACPATPSPAPPH